MKIIPDWLENLLPKGNQPEKPDAKPRPTPGPSADKPPEVKFPPPKAKHHIMDVSKVAIPTPPTAIPQPNSTENTQSTMPETPPPPPQPAASAIAGDFEKSLALAGQKMDRLIADTDRLTKQLREAESGRAADHKRLAEANAELIEQQRKKDEQIASLTALLEQKAGQASVKSLVEVRKICQDLLGTPKDKQLGHDELVNWIAADIDQKLANLDVLTEEFPVGTPLAKIPGDQLESSPRYEPTEDAAKANTVARSIRPCYYFKTDSRRIIIAKASVVLYRLTQPTPATPTSSTPPA
jgi:hypothetical protein